MNRCVQVFGKLLAVATVFVGLSGTARADLFSWTSTPNSVSYTDTATTFTINFVNPGTGGPVTGIFSGLNNGAVTMATPISNTQSLPFQVMQVVEGAETMLVTLNSLTFSTSPTLALFGNGTESINGGPSQQISFQLTTQGASGSPVSYSGTIQTTPLPGALALFGTGMVGFWGWSRKRRKAA
jgi:hypothetical protein